MPRGEVACFTIVNQSLQFNTAEEEDFFSSNEFLMKTPRERQLWGESS